MKSIFVDTAALIAIGNSRDAFHVRALQINQELRKSRRWLVTTSAILLEFGNAFSGIRLRPVAVKMIQAIRGSDRWNLVRLDDSFLDRGFQKYRHVMDKEWGLVDCVSMVVAEDLGISQVFTTDHHFEQAGFEILLKNKG